MYNAHLPARLAENEKCMKKELRSKEKEREAADRRLTDTTEALRLQKELRMKSMLEQQVGQPLLLTMDVGERLLLCSSNSSTFGL